MHEDKSKKNAFPQVRGKAYKLRRRHTLPHVTAVPFALMGLTSLFGMGRGGHHR